MADKIKTDEKKQHFDDIYVEPTPVPYKIRILDALDYISDTYNREMFDAHILPHVKDKTVNFVDLCACFGNTTMATIYGMSYDEIRDNWKDETSCMTIQGKRRIDDCETTAIDISQPAMEYGKKVGLFDNTMSCDLNDRSTQEFGRTVDIMTNANVLICTAALVYLDLESIEKIVTAFASGDGEGYVLVNFLNPFALEKGDETKRILLEHLEFVSSRATRHRRLSKLEQDNYPGDEWALLELWVLKRPAGKVKNEECMPCIVS
mmetsp:Transcript_9139/g.10551  ORF Transcript_9139/g.10551 Transcript_9139/m.10551 type:complete len:263 (+) Transcript_9139:45-833(+)